MNCPLSGNPCNNHKCFHITDISKEGNVSDVSCCLNCMALYIGPKETKPLNFLTLLVKTIDFLTHGLVPFFDTKEVGPPEPPKPSRVCPRCGWAATDVLKTKGKMGCPNCYSYFDFELQNILGMMHNTSNPKHVGKKPKAKPIRIKKTSVDVRLRVAEESLREAISKEQYEQAAEIKKSIESLTEKLERKKKIIKQMQVALDNKETNLLSELRKLLEEIDQE